MVCLLFQQFVHGNAEVVGDALELVRLRAGGAPPANRTVSEAKITLQSENRNPFFGTQPFN